MLTQTASIVSKISEVSECEQQDLRNMFICAVPPTPQLSVNRAKDRWKNM